jgi:hypothetical protein
MSNRFDRQQDVLPLAFMARQESSASSAVLGDPFPSRRNNSSWQFDIGKAQLVPVPAGKYRIRLFSDFGYPSHLQGLEHGCVELSLFRDQLENSRTDDEDE